MSAFTNRHQVDCLYLDFAKAFDTVNHSFLLAKLQGYGVVGNLLRWFESYLRNRQLSVKLAGSGSRFFTATSGVPQGSLLGPLLFIIFINDIHPIISYSELLLFADDAKIFKEIMTPQDCLLLQSDISRIVDWCEANEMNLNISKCSILTFARIKSPFFFAYILGGYNLARTDSVKDLGVFVSTDFGPEKHIVSICSRANSLLGFIVRAGRDQFSCDALRTLYVHLVRPLLEYASTVWTPYQVGHRNMLESVQRRFVRLIGLKLGFDYSDVPFCAIERRFRLPALEIRHKLLDALFLRKLLTAEVDCPDLLLEIDLRAVGYSRHNQLFARRHCSTGYMYNSVIPRISRLGNILPSQIDIFSMGTDSFKGAVLQFLLENDSH